MTYNSETSECLPQVLRAKRMFTVNPYLARYYTLLAASIGASQNAQRLEPQPLDTLQLPDLELCTWVLRRCVQYRLDAKGNYSRVIAIVTADDAMFSLCRISEMDLGSMHDRARNNVWMGKPHRGPQMVLGGDISRRSEIESHLWIR